MIKNRIRNFRGYQFTCKIGKYFNYSIWILAFNYGVIFNDMEIIHVAFSWTLFITFIVITSQESLIERLKKENMKGSHE